MLFCKSGGADEALGESGDKGEFCSNVIPNESIPTYSYAAALVVLLNKFIMISG